MTELTVASVLAAALEATELVTEDEDRIRLKARVADVMRDTGHEAVFGSFVADARRAEDEVSRKYANPEKQARWDRVQELESEAERLLLAGEWARAIVALTEAEGLREISRKWKDLEAGARGLLLGCHLRSGDFAAAISVIETGEWPTAFQRVSVRHALAEGTNQ